MIRSDAMTALPRRAEQLRAVHGWRTPVRLLVATFQRFFGARADMLSGAIAYFTALSLAPLLLFAIAIVGTVFDEDAARQQVFEQLSTSIGPTAAAEVKDLLAAAAVGGQGWKILLGVVIAGWSASQIFLCMQDAVNDIWGVRTKKIDSLRARAELIVRKRAGSFALTLGVGALLFASMSTKSIMAGIHGVTGSLPFDTILWPVLESIASLVLVTTFVLVLYRWLPDVELGLADVWLGALLASLLATVGAFALSVYLGYLATSSLSGAAGGVLALLLWIYYNAQVFLLGAEFTRVYTEWRRGDVLPEPHAERVPMPADLAPIGAERSRPG